MPADGLAAHPFRPKHPAPTQTAHPFWRWNGCNPRRAPIPAWQNLHCGGGETVSDGQPAKRPRSRQGLRRGRCGPWEDVGL